MPARSDDPLRRVTLNGTCLEYQGSTNDDGYGQFWFEGRHWLAHRYAYTKCYGPIPVGGIVRHTCDNPSCVEFKHLVLGTQQNNIDDCIARGRRYVHDRKITLEQFEEMVYLQSNGYSYSKLAAHFSVSKQTIYRYLNGHMSCQ